MKKKLGGGSNGNILFFFFLPKHDLGIFQNSPESSFRSILVLDYSPILRARLIHRKKLGETACIGVPEKGLLFVTSLLVAIPHNPHNFLCQRRSQEGRMGGKPRSGIFLGHA